jgi:hypothetical protein
MKKALAGPAKPAAKRKPMIAAVRGRIAGRRKRRLAGAPKRLAGAVPRRLASLTLRLDRALARALELARRPAGRIARRWSHAAGRLIALFGRLLRPPSARLFRAAGRLERGLRRGGSAAARWATAASRVITPSRAVCGVLVASAACLAVSQFIDYRSVQIGHPGYAGLPEAAAPPSEGARTAGAAHAYVLLPLAILAAALALLAQRRSRRGLGRLVIAIGLLSIALIVLVDRPAGLDAGAQAERFAGTRAVLEDGFYAELAAAAGLVLGGLLYYAPPCRTRTNLSGRAASALRRRRRRRASSRGRAARSGSPRRSGGESAPASPR